MDGFKQSKLSNQCNHRYKIYAEGYAWSVSLKYILACGCVPLIINPKYDDFFSRGLFPKRNYLPISPENICPSIKTAVEWGNENPIKVKFPIILYYIFIATISLSSFIDLHLILFWGD